MKISIYGYEGKIPVGDLMGLIKQTADIITKAGIDKDADLSVSWYESNRTDENTHTKWKQWTMSLSASGQMTAPVPIEPVEEDS